MTVNYIFVWDDIVKCKDYLDYLKLRIKNNTIIFFIDTSKLKDIIFLSGYASTIQQCKQRMHLIPATYNRKIIKKRDDFTV